MMSAKNKARDAAEEIDRGFIDRMSKAVDLAGGQSALARAAGISQAVIHRYLNGGDPSRSKIIAIANGVQVSVLWLVTGEGPMRPEEGYAPASLGQAPASLLQSEAQPPASDTIIANVVSGVEHLRRQLALNISPEAEGRLVALFCRILARRMAIHMAAGTKPPDYLVQPDSPFDIAAEPDLADMFGMLK